MSQNENNSSSQSSATSSVASVGADAVKAAAGIAKAATKAAAQDYVGAAIEVAKSGGSILKIIGIMLFILFFPLIIMLVGFSSMLSPFDVSTNPEKITQDTMYTNTQYLASSGKTALESVGNVAVMEVMETFESQIDNFGERLELWKDGKQQLDEESTFIINKSGNRIVAILSDLEGNMMQQAILSSECQYGIYRLNLLLMPFAMRTDEFSSGEMLPNVLGKDGITTKQTINNMCSWLGENTSNIVRVETKREFGGIPLVNVEALPWEAICGMATSDPEDAQYFMDNIPITEDFQKEILSQLETDLSQEILFDVTDYVANKIFGMSLPSVETTSGSDVEMSDIVYSGNYKMPMRLPTISSLFGDRVIFGKNERHNGLDMYGSSSHAEILSIADGRIYAVSKSNQRGLNVRVEYIDDNGNKFYAMYQHLSASKVRTGQTVKAGQVIGLQGGGGIYCADLSCRKNTGTSTGHHLHFEVSSHTSFSSKTVFDPLTILSGEQFD